MRKRESNSKEEEENSVAEEEEEQTLLLVFNLRLGCRNKRQWKFSPLVRKCV